MSSTLYETRGANALIRLDYPPVNGLGAALRQGLMQALDRALADAHIKAIVVHLRDHVGHFARRTRIDFNGPDLARSSC